MAIDCRRDYDSPYCFVKIKLKRKELSDMIHVMVDHGYLKENDQKESYLTACGRIIARRDLVNGDQEANCPKCLRWKKKGI